MLIGTLSAVSKLGLQGCRVPAFVAGGVLPPRQRGKQYPLGIAHVIDWYRTFANLAAANASSDAAAAPAPLESLDLWPWLAGTVPASPRTEVVYDHRMNGTDSGWNTTLLPGHAMGALRVGRWKLVVGATKQASWYGHFTPNRSACGNSAIVDNAALSAGTGESGKCPSIAAAACTASPCLFDVQVCVHACGRYYDTLHACMWSLRHASSLH